ncbi:hypothetical protein Mapa_014307 [Marchantia paleacea]|nr:hypothetical protein Mapa_014307 [Marchantia paleacea]
MAILGTDRKRLLPLFLFLVVLALHVIDCSSAILDRRPVYDSRHQDESETQDGKVHCSRPRSRTASKILDEYLLPFLEKEQYNLSSACRLNPENNMFKDQELQKDNVRPSQWQCGYCKKTFRTEDYLDKHLDNRHYGMLDLNSKRCSADICGAIHCDHVDSVTKATTKKRCNRAAMTKNKHLCEALANECFPSKEGATALRLNEFFLRQFCDSHTCDGGPKHFPRGTGRRKNKSLYMALCLFLIILLGIFYLAVYLYQREMSGDASSLKRLRQHPILKAQKSKKF